MLEVYDLTVSQYEKERNSLSFYQCGIEICMQLKIRHSY